MTTGRVSDAIEGLLKAHQFWSIPRLDQKMRDSGIKIEAVDFKTEMAYLKVQLPVAAPVWVAPHICPLVAAGGAGYPLDLPLDPTAVPFAAAWVWFADPLPIPNRDSVRALLVRAVRADKARAEKVTPVSDPAVADGLWVHIFLDMPEQRPLPWMSGMVAIDYARPADWLTYVRALNGDKGGWKLPQADLDTYAAQGEAVMGYTLALLAFLRQKVVVEERRPIEHRGTAKRLARDGWRGDMAVRVITLRAAEPGTRGREEGRAAYDHRFMVRGHWRQQACGPRKSQRRATWIDSFVKGDPSLPLARPQWTAYKVAR